MKNKNRSIRELLIILRREMYKQYNKVDYNGQRGFDLGICFVVSYITEIYITTEEYYILKKYINDNPPINREPKMLDNMYGAYWYKKGSFNPRIKWVRKQIELLS
jgi:uncharacterized protein YneF (UPF0154 family)